MTSDAKVGVICAFLAAVVLLVGIAAGTYHSRESHRERMESFRACVQVQEPSECSISLGIVHD